MDRFHQLQLEISYIYRLIIQLLMILNQIIEEANKVNLGQAISGEYANMVILEMRNGKVNEMSQESLCLDLPSQTKKEDIEKIKTIIEEVKQKLNSEVDVELEVKLGAGNPLPNFGQISKVFGEGTAELAANPGQVLLIDVWATWCGPCQKPMAHNQDMIVKNKNIWGDKVRIVGVSVDDNVDTIKNRVYKNKWHDVEHLALGGWKHDHSLIKTFSISGIPFVCLVDTHGKIVFTGHPSSINLEQKINELLKSTGEAPKEEVAKGISEEQALQILKSVGNKEQFEKLFGKIEFISTKVEVICTATKGDTVYKSKIQVYVNPEDKHLLEEYKKHIPSCESVEFTGKTVANVEVPKIPEHCSDCKGPLKYPLYWCKWSKIENDFRCCACVEKKIDQKKFHYDQNSVLLMQEVKNIPTSNLGNNIQPAAEPYETHRFGCNGCGNCPTQVGQVRYVCGGCRSQPNYRGDFVDLCEDCMTKYIKGDQHVKSKLEPDGHKSHHSFVRLLYSTGNYYKF